MPDALLVARCRRRSAARTELNGSAVGLSWVERSYVAGRKDIASGGRPRQRENDSSSMRLHALGIGQVMEVLVQHCLQVAVGAVAQDCAPVRQVVRVRAESSSRVDSDRLNSDRRPVASTAAARNGPTG